MYIDGFGVTNYKSFGSKLQLIGGFNKINLIIGQNNVSSPKPLARQEQGWEQGCAAEYGRPMKGSHLERHAV
jgi:hypothetical protein